MKMLLTLSLFFLVQFQAQAHPPRQHHRGKVVAVHGKNAKAIYEALGVNATVKDRPNFTVERKKVGTLVCVRAVRKETNKERFTCLLKKKTHRHPRRRPDRNEATDQLNLTGEAEDLNENVDEIADISEE